jgi:hypothetical protein
MCWKKEGKVSSLGNFYAAHVGDRFYFGDEIIWDDITVLCML